MNKKYYILILIPVLVYCIYWGNVKPFLASRIAIDGHAQKALSYDTFINYELRKIIAQQARESDSPKIVVFAIEQIEENIKQRPLDCKSYILATYLYRRIGENEKAQENIKKAIELSPKRQDIKQLLIDISK